MSDVHTDTDIDLALDDRQAQFWQVVAVAESMSRVQANRHQKTYEKNWDSGVNRAAGLAYKQLKRAGRITDEIDYAIDGLCGIVGGASDVAIAVLARDLISADDYERMTRWWRVAGLPLAGPQPAVHVRPAQPSVNASRVCGTGAVLLAAGGFYAVWQGWLTFESRYLPLAVAVVFLLGFGALAFRHAADRIDAPAILIDDQEV